MAYAINKVTGLSSTLQAVGKACKFVERYSGLIRPFVPTESRAVYDNAVTALTALCEILKVVARDQITELG